MDGLLKSVLSGVGMHLKSRRHHHLADDDCVDRLSHRSTVVVLVCFALVVSTKQFVGDPICCWCPTEFTHSQRRYANAVCWVNNTYYVTIDDTTPPSSADVVNLDPLLLDPKHDSPPRMIYYYQWVPLILVLQALLSFCPCLVWRFLNQKTGVNLDSIMAAARVCSESSHLEVRQMAVRYIVNQIDHYLHAERDRRTGCCVKIKQLVARMCCSLAGGGLIYNYLVKAYLSVKFLYLANSVGQIYLLERFLAVDHNWFGVYVLERLIRGRLDWSESERFPRVTVCQFEVRQQSRVQHYVVQCALPINLFNEKIFIFVCFWYVAVAMATVASILGWLFRSFYWPGQVRYVAEHLLTSGTRHRGPSEVLAAEFTRNYLRRDGNFLLRLVAINMGQVVASEILSGLWNNYNSGRRLTTKRSRRRRQHSSNRWTVNGEKRVEIV